MLIEITDPEAPWPRATRLTLSCDGGHAPFYQTFEHEDGYMAQRRAAMNAGWKDTSRDGVRVFYGPCCSGKRETGDDAA